MNHDSFIERHIGPRSGDIERMLAVLGVSSLDELIDQVIPASIRTTRGLHLPAARREHEVIEHLRLCSEKNQVHRSYLGMGYYGTHVPPVIQRNVLENPGWYTAYTPYQAEIAQGRLEALVLFQMVVQDLTGMPVSNASLLDEGTAAAEAMAMCLRVTKHKVPRFFLSELCHPQTIAVVETRAAALGIDIVVGDHRAFDPRTDRVCGALIQYPATDGSLQDFSELIEGLHETKALAVVASDLLALTVLRPPGEWGADIVIGSSQRFGVPLGYGGPHAAFLATQARHQRKMPGRIIGVSRDRHGQVALRMALQTREQHIRRAKATSNVCTAQVLLAVMAAFYAVYHGPDGLRRIAETVRARVARLVAGLSSGGINVVTEAWFDTIVFDVGERRDDVVANARARGINLRSLGETRIAVSFDETVEDTDVDDVLEAVGCAALGASTVPALPTVFARTSAFLEHPAFHRYRSETEMLRYLHRLQARDLSLTTAMIPLGSCTMKLNATAEMAPVTLPGFSNIHPFAPVEQVGGYAELIGELEQWLAEITGFAAISMQPNAGSQGEFAGLLVIRAYLDARGESQRRVCLIPKSAHGTNPASAVMAGLRVVEVECDENGNIDVDDLTARAVEHSAELAALMVTYPSTHGVFEESISQLCEIVHDHGGQVYMDGANLNAMVGLCRPAMIGADVCHLNLHKTFAIPHGGGGPGMGPIGVAAHLVPHLPNHPVVSCGGSLGPVSAAPWGSPSILPISWAYCALLGPDGLRRTAQIAILNANYIAKRLEGHYPILYTGFDGFVAHECIVDARHFKESAGIEVDDIAKRLMDYGFHGPTMSWPVHGTLMVEPTESESLDEIERFIEAMVLIREEIRAVEEGRMDPQDNVLKNAPHTAAEVASDEWSHSYTRGQAAYPTAWTRKWKFWPTVARVDNVFGDRNLQTFLPEAE